MSRLIACRPVVRLMLRAGPAAAPLAADAALPAPAAAPMPTSVTAPESRARALRRMRDSSRRGGGRGATVAVWNPSRARIGNGQDYRLLRVVELVTVVGLDRRWPVAGHRGRA